MTTCVPTSPPRVHGIPNAVARLRLVTQREADWRDRALLRPPLQQAQAIRDAQAAVTPQRQAPVTQQGVSPVNEEKSRT
jgi:hypothetical protein